VADVLLEGQQDEGGHAKQHELVGHVVHGRLAAGKNLSGLHGASTLVNAMHVIRM
jgi:hypothetical protein